jgi:hypothetical protein
MENFTYHRNKGSDFRIGLLIFDPQCFWPAIHSIDQRKAAATKEFSRVFRWQ